MGRPAVDEVARAWSALQALDASCDGARWVRIGMAAKAAGLPFEDFDAWSATAANYGGETDTRSRWHSFRDGGGITAATLFHMARECGWRDGAAPTHERKSAPARKPEPIKAPRHPAADVWARCAPATAAHGYIARKGIVPDGLGVYPDSAPSLVIRNHDVRGWLVVPAHDAQRALKTLQFISPTAGAPKLNLPSHQFDGGSFQVGDVRAGATVYVAEGIGAACTAHAATGCAAAVAFGAGNQSKVAASLRALGARPVIVSDRGKEDACERAARALGCAWVAMPDDLADNEDLNDVQHREGLEAVAAVLSAERAPAGTSTRDEQRRAEQKAENERLQELPFSILPPSMTVDAMLDDCVWIASGSQVGRISNPKAVLGFGEFADLMAASASFETGEDGKRRRVPHAVKWKHSEDRKTVYVRTFHAGAGVICTDPDGQPALNSWRPIERTPASRDVAPFIEQVGYLFAEATERDAFLNWLAHIEQRPGELPHYGWLHIAANTGTGRNWLASVLARVWRGYVAPNVDLPALLDSQFNGQLAGRVLAIVDEVQEAAGENPYRHTNKLKSLVNAEYRDLNPKFGRQYREHNACRWLVFSNHDNALPLNDTDRRWRVVRHDAAPRSPDDYAALYAMLADAEFINAVGVYLRERDITAFKPGERPPMSDAKRAAVGASKTLTQRYAEELMARWPADVVTNADAAQVMSDGAQTCITPAMRRALEEVGATGVRQTLYVHGRTHRGWVLRNREQWATASAGALAAEAARARPFADRFDNALDLMAQCV